MATKSSTNSPQRSVTPIGLMHLGVVYVVWSSTYLAIRIAVREGSGFPPFTMAIMRVAAASAILFVWAWVSKKRIKLDKREVLILGLSGLLLWTGGNGLVTWAEQHAESGLAAIVLASLTIWVAVIEAVIDRRAPSKLLAGSLLAGLSGIAVLTYPTLQSGVRADIFSLLALIGATISWGIGTVLQTRNHVDVSARVSAAYQMAAGGVGFAILLFLFDEPAPTPTTEAWLAWGYLVLFGAVLAFTSYVSALRMLPTKIVMTYAYVNPVLAVFLGWIVLREGITGWTVMGAILVLSGVAGVFRERYQESTN
ncbi:MAG: EamA family transporter [Chloroflexi bacterium]|nr:EamA family transporter [Chloroflexota bacterium]